MKTMNRITVAFREKRQLHSDLLDIFIDCENKVNHVKSRMASVYAEIGQFYLDKHLEDKHILNLKKQMDTYDSCFELLSNVVNVINAKNSISSSENVQPQPATPSRIESELAQNYARQNSTPTTPNQGLSSEFQENCSWQQAIQGSFDRENESFEKLYNQDNTITMNAECRSGYNQINMELSQSRLSRTERLTADNEMNSALVRTCEFCHASDHVYLSECTLYEAYSVEKRWKFAKELGQCYSCLNGEHLIKCCDKRKYCGIDGCIKYHHPRLHRYRPIISDIINTDTHAANCDNSDNPSEMQTQNKNNEANTVINIWEQLNSCDVDDTNILKSPWTVPIPAKTSDDKILDNSDTCTTNNVNKPESYVCGETLINIDCIDSDSEEIKSSNFNKTQDKLIMNDNINTGKINSQKYSEKLNRGHLDNSPNRNRLKDFLCDLPIPNPKTDWWSKSKYRNRNLSRFNFSNIVTSLFPVNYHWY